MVLKRKTPRYTVVGGKQGRSVWFCLDDEQRKQWRIFLVQDNLTQERYWAADYKLCGIVPKECAGVRLEEVETRRQAWNVARSQLSQLALPMLVPEKQVST